MLLCKILSLSKIQSGNLNGIPTPEKPCDLRNLTPGKNRDQHMNIVQLQLSYSNLTLFLKGLLIFTGMLIPGNVKL
jgi:hypothetical protein